MTRAESGWNISPTQGLILEVLCARHRLGETIWTFESSAAVTKALKQLEAKDLVITHNGMTEKTVRAELTAAGRAEVIDPDYTPPNPPPMDPDFVEAARKILDLKEGHWIKRVRPVRFEVTVVQGRYTTTTDTRTLEIN